MNLIASLPEIILLALTLLLLMVDVFLPKGKVTLTWALSIASVFITAALTFYLSTLSTQTIGTSFKADLFSHVLKLITLGLTIGIFVYVKRYAKENELVEGEIGGEFYILALFCLLGQMVLISATNFLVVYLGIELLSLPLYALVAIQRKNKKATEASMKYFILGALSSGFLLYGISMLYGASGTLDLEVLSRIQEPSTIFILGLVFVVSGIAFKLGAAPFHMWVPDVYEGAPTAVTLLLSTAPKIATFALCVRVLFEGLFPLSESWQHMLMVVSILSLAIGNITAIIQKNLKRMLAYSAIGQIGFMLLGLLSGIPNGRISEFTAISYSSALFYTIIYVLALLGALGVMLALSKAGFDAENLEDYKGLHRKNPYLAFFMMIFMLSLTGIPPIAGFYAKFAVLEAVISCGYLWLALIAIVLSVVAAFYYLRVVKYMYFEKGSEEKIKAAPLEMIFLWINTLLVIALGLYPNSLMNLCYMSFVPMI